MSFEAGRPTRPVAVMPTFTDALATGTMPGQQQSSTAIQADFQSASTPVKPQQAPATYPEIATFSEINQLFPGATLMARQQQMLRCVETANRGRLEGGDAMVYACRHPAAEQKRSTRINNSADEKLMKAVPAPSASQLGGAPHAAHAPQGRQKTAEDYTSDPDLFPLYRGLEAKRAELQAKRAEVEARRPELEARRAEHEARILRDLENLQQSRVTSLGRGCTGESIPEHEVRSAGAANPAGTTPQSANTSTGLGGIGQKPAASGLSSAPAITPEYLDSKFNMVISSLEGLTDVLKKGFADVAAVKDHMERILPKLANQAAGMDSSSKEKHNKVKGVPHVPRAESPASDDEEHESEEETQASKLSQGELQQSAHPAQHATEGTATAQVKVQVRPGVRISKPTVHHNVSSGKALAAQGSAPTQVKAQARPGICILKPLAHFNVLSGKAIAEQGSVPTQVAKPIASPFTEPSSDIPVNTSRDDPLCPSQSLQGESRSALQREATLMDFLKECPRKPMTVPGTGKGHAPSPGRTQDQDSFAFENDSSGASSDGWIDLLQVLRGSDDATEEPTQAPTCGKPACAGGAVKLALPQKVLQEVWSLRAAAEHNKGITDLLEEAGCKDEIQMLQEITSKAMATVQDKNCAKQSLLKEIAAVYSTIECALSEGAQSADRDAGKKCALLLRSISEWRPESAELMAAQYEYQRPIFIKMIADSMEAICKAATAALEPVLSEKFMREACKLTAFFQGTKVLQDCLIKVQSSSVLTELQEASSKGAATMRGTWAEQGLEKEVASVYKALEEALHLADESGNDLKLLHRYCTEGEESMKHLSANSREYLIKVLAFSMQLISEAATGALEKVRRPQIKPL